MMLTIHIHLALHLQRSPNDVQILFQLTVHKSLPACFSSVPCSFMFMQTDLFHQPVSHYQTKKLFFLSGCRRAWRGEFLGGLLKKTQKENSLVTIFRGALVSSGDSQKGEGGINSDKKTRSKSPRCAIPHPNNTKAFRPN